MSWARLPQLFGALSLAAAGLLAAGAVAAQGTTGPAPSPAAPAAPGAATTPNAPAASAASCPKAGTEMKTEALFGQWEARFDDLPVVASLQLGKHPDYDGVRGKATRPAAGGGAAQVSMLAGDIGEDGMLNLDESLDGHAISGVWLGQLQADSCGKVFKGIWRDALDDTQHNFTLTKTGAAAASTP
jgi:hypothetical protein